MTNPRRPCQCSVRSHTPVLAMQWMVEALSELDCNVRLFGSQDGSGQGAGLIALGAVKGAGVEAGAGGAGAGSV